jgi:predicted  nucleic acid-binding Zn-ribbon protein
MDITIETSQEQSLIQQLLACQPNARALLQRLLYRFEGKTKFGAFAPIEGHRCGACHLLIPPARLARAREEQFIPCANCSRFLYYPATEAAPELPPAA